jgi:hypothetical protein
MYLTEMKSIASKYNDAKWMLNFEDSHNTLKLWQIIPTILRAAAMHMSESKLMQRNCRHIGIPGRTTTYCMTDH